LNIRLTLESPNNQGQQAIENRLWEEIINFRDNPIQPSSSFFMVLGPAGTGKTSLMKKLHARCRSEGILIQCCASTTLASLMTEGGKTAHSLFKYPVSEDEDIDEESKPKCRLYNTERLAMLNETTVIFWDEFISNHRYIFEAVQRIITKKIVYVFTGDFAQILPVMKYATPDEIMNSTILFSDYWSKFQILYLTENMRILNLANSLNTMSDRQRRNANDQIQYNATLLNIASNISSVDCNVIEEQVPDKHTNIIALTNIQYFQNDEESIAVSWLYPNNEFNCNIAMNRVILSTTNDSVDKWNTLIQDLNPNESIPLLSKDEFNEVDDPHGYLQQNLTPDMLNSINANSIPLHSLNLKVNDVCLVLRPLMCDDIATNMRVQILEISEFLIRALILTDNINRTILIPRIRFKFRFSYGSFEMLRTQFPLRLAYSMTINKAQGQTLQNVLFDCRKPPFSHGHTYVAMSRVRDVNNIKLFISDDQKHTITSEDSTIPDKIVPKIPNIVYQHVIQLNSYN
jgi:hypothetical protein